MGNRIKPSHWNRLFGVLSICIWIGMGNRGLFLWFKIGITNLNRYFCCCWFRALALGIVTAVYLEQVGLTTFCAMRVQTHFFGPFLDVQQYICFYFSWFYFPYLWLFQQDIPSWFVHFPFHYFLLSSSIIWSWFCFAVYVRWSAFFIFFFYSSTDVIHINRWLCG